VDITRTIYETAASMAQSSKKAAGKAIIAADRIVGNNGFESVYRSRTITWR
jgi:hypothetical protein